MLYIPASENNLAPVTELHMQLGEDVHIIGPEGDEVVVYVNDDGMLQTQT